MEVNRIDIVGIALRLIEHVLAEAYDAPIEPSEGVRLALAVLVKLDIAQLWQARQFWHHLRTYDATVAGPTNGYVRKSGLNSMVGAWYRVAKRKEPKLSERAAMRNGCKCIKQPD
jgi:hypothetical protein